ncbi:MAG: phosphatidate cytidylyltransferase [Alphaproteobacteria bacterium]|nr:phosphatidate cytidylyltransferase [Alphaproteobacteria bacterium]
MPEATNTVFRLRLISGTVLAIAALAAVYAGGVWFAGLVVAGLVLMIREWPELCLAAGGARPLWRPRPPLAAAGFVVIALIALVLLLTGRIPAAVALAVAGAPVVALLAGGGVRDRLLLGCGLPYIVVPAAALLWISSAPQGRLTLLWLLVVVWATDIGGYAVGKLIGGPRLAPRISPGKTWAGFAGATVLAAGAGAAFVVVVPDVSALRLVLAAVGLSLAAQGGDLLESAVKRHFALKDSGTIIPGHGGVFDRLDGLLAAAPLLAVLTAVSGNPGFLWR